LARRDCGSSNAFIFLFPFFVLKVNRPSQRY
jgi:hypothetical protein